MRVTMTINKIKNTQIFTHKSLLRRRNVLVDNLFEKKCIPPKRTIFLDIISDSISCPHLPLFCQYILGNVSFYCHPLLFSRNIPNSF